MQPINPQHQCCILNSGGGSWAFTPLAAQLSAALWIEISETPREFNYLLLADEEVAAKSNVFIPFASMQTAADKRLLARMFAKHGVPVPETHLLDSLLEAKRFLSSNVQREWCLKYPTGCGAAGHRPLTPDTTLPRDWPLPLVVQEFIRLKRPEVYRLYAAGGQPFGWVARRFPAGVKPSLWVAHARGARYEEAGDPPPAAVDAARAALAATQLLDSFGCADLLQRPTGEWVVLEVGTDGMFNHVDRDLGLPALEQEIQHRIADAFWTRLGDSRPWGSGQWHSQTPVPA